MAVYTVEQFLAVLEKSKLLSPEQLSDARLAAPQDNDPKTIAKALVQKGLLTRWQAGQMLAGRSSFFLGKYKLIEPIGRGGMGGVFLGQHTTMNRPVALKILSRQVGKDPASLERFLDEARAIAALDHPHIVQAYSVDHDADRYYLVMEYIDGRDLQQLVEREGPPDYKTAADYIRQAADGLAHGHSRNMIHCDIKPSNLLVSRQGVLKIVDMGLTRLDGRGPQDADRQGERVLGSVDYLAPEQALESSDFDHRADIYSLGCTLYFLLTGHPPFPEGTLPERILKHQMQQPRSIRRERRGAPPGLVKICEKMMAKRPEDRFQSAAEVGRALAKWDEWELPEPGPRRAVLLKTAEPLEEPAGGRLPAIHLDAAPEATGGDAAAKVVRSSRPGIFRTRTRRLAALGVAGLATAAVAAAAAAWLIARVPLAELVSADRDGTQAWPHTVAAGKNAPTRRPTFGRFPVPGKRFGPSDGSAGSRGKSPEKKPADDEPPGGRSSADKPPVHEPPAGRPPDEKPPADPRKVAPQHSAPPEVLKPEPEQPKEGPENRHEPDGPKKDPFRLLGAAVDLPVLRASAGPDGQSGVPVVLGTLQLEPHALCVVELKGGQDAVPGNRHLSLDPQPHGNTWLIRLDAEGKQQPDGQRTDLARIWLEEQTLKFQWLSGAGRARGNYLRNCGLLVGVGNQTRWLPLGRPKTVEPLVLDLESGTARRSLPSAEWMPKIGKLRLQVTGLEGPFPAHKFRPASGISEDGQVDILLSGEKLPRVGLCVGLSSRGRVVSVQVSAVYQLANQVQRSLNRKDALGLAGEFYALQSRWQKTLDQLGEKDPRRADLSRQIDLLKESLEQLKALGDLYRRLHHTGKIHFRVFHTVGDHQIELFTTKPTTPVDGRVGPGP